MSNDVIAEDLAKKSHAISEILYAATSNNYEPSQQSINIVLDIQESICCELTDHFKKAEEKIND